MSAFIRRALGRRNPTIHHVTHINPCSGLHSSVVSSARVRRGVPPSLNEPTSSEDSLTPSTSTDRSKKPPVMSDRMIDEILDDLFLDPSVSQFKRTKKKTSTPITPVKDDPLRQMIQEQKDLSASTPHEKPIEPSSRASADQPKEDPVETLWKEQEQILLQDQPISKKKSTSPSVSRESQEQRLERKSIVKNYYEQETQEVEAQKETKPADAKESVKKDEDWYLDQAYNVTSGTTKKDTQDWANFTPRWMKKPTTESQPMQPTPESITEKYDPSLLNLSDVVSQLKAEKAQNITVINMREKCDYADYFIIAEGASKRQIYGIADGVRRFAKKKIATDPRIPSSLSVEGAQTEDWMVVDLGRYMLHIFSPESRQAYDLDGLWTLIRDPMMGLANEAKAQRVIDGFAALEPQVKHIKDLEEKDIPTEDMVMGVTPDPKA